MNVKSDYLNSLLVLSLCAVGGFILASTGLSIGWMLGSLFASVGLTYINPKALTLSMEGREFWLRAGQLLLGMHLGLQLNLSVFHVLKENSLIIIIVLALSMIYSIGSGILLYKTCNLDILTGLYSSAPGGISAMPGMAKDAGANVGVVTVLQTSRVLLVVVLVPLFILGSSHSGIGEATQNVPGIHSSVSGLGILWTFLFIGAAWCGAKLGKKVKLPTPWLLGGLLTVASIQASSYLFTAQPITVWWPDSVMVLSQIMIGTSVGSMITKGMFSGIRKIMLVSLLSTVGFILAMMVCAWIISKMSGMSYITTALALAPGGVAEMTAASVILNADPMFVVAVQILRVVMMPPLFHLVHNRALREKNSHA
ncbi:AbrB family transcriptional regulator [Peribacillus sp. SCS-155]|uniref:AbrB family transcriptional regulator n=1 Tax=Peribacillus sedimenti TaxID=3115297 RepID=UPI003905B0A8